MEDYNAKKARAHKLRQDKHRDRHKKKPSSGSQTGQTIVRNANQDSKEKDKKIPSDSENSDAEGSDSKSEIFSRRKMVSNWDRYEETVLNRFEEEAEPSGALFEELLAMPTTGGHLKMKHEQDWGKEKSELQQVWFQLDIKDVEKNLATIPFLQRQSLPSSIFTESHLQRMITRAKQNAASLTDVNEGILKMQNLCVTSKSKSEASSKSKPREEPKDPEIKSVEVQNRSVVQENTQPLENDDLDSLLALDVSFSNPVNIKLSESGVSSVTKGDSLLDDPVKTTPLQSSPVSANPACATSAQPSVSLDDWLDSILDD